MKIVFFELPPFFQPLFAELSKHHEVVFAEAPLSAENAGLYRDAEIVSTFNESDISEEVLKKLPRLRHIALRKTGFDDLPQSYCDDKGITFSTVPNYGRQTVAEHTFALLLALSHRIIPEVTRARQGDFIPKAPPGFDLAGRTMGVIGTGNIGRYVIRTALGFGMKVVAHDIAPDAGLFESLDFEYLDKDEVIARADVLTLHVPLTESTHHLIDRREIDLMKPGSVLINTSRGEVVNILPLTEALQAGKLRGACLDVYPQEPLLRAGAVNIDLHPHPEVRCVQTLLKMTNVITAPHVGYNTVEAIERILTTTLENIEAFARG